MSSSSRASIKFRSSTGNIENGGFRTPTGKIELYSTRFEQMGYAPLPSYEEPPESPISTPKIAAHYPLVLTTGGRISFFFNSEHRQIDRLRKAHRDPVAEIHPDTASRLGIVERRMDVDRDAARPHAAKSQDSPTASTRASSTSSTAGGSPSRQRPTMACGPPTPTS